MVKIKLKFMLIVLEFIKDNTKTAKTHAKAINLINEIYEYEEAHNYE